MMQGQSFSAEKAFHFKSCGSFAVNRNLSQTEKGSNKQ